MTTRLCIAAVSALFLYAPAYAAAPAPAAQAAAPIPVPVPAAAAPVPVPATPAKAAPDVQEQVNTALSEYKEKHFGKAADALDAASEQLREMKSNALVAFLPAAPKGWTVDETKGLSYGHHIMGNGSDAQRVYTSGGESVTLRIEADGKLLGTLRKLGSTNAGSMKFLGYDYTFKNGDPAMPVIVRRNEGTLFPSDNLVIRVLGDKLTDQQAQGFIGLIDIAKLKTEAEK